MAHGSWLMAQGWWCPAPAPGALKWKLIRGRSYGAHFPHLESIWVVVKGGDGGFPEMVVKAGQCSRNACQGGGEGVPEGLPSKLGREGACE